MRREQSAGKRQIGARVVLQPYHRRAHAAAGGGGFAAPALGACIRRKRTTRVAAHEKARAEVHEERGVGGSFLRARRVRLRRRAESGFVGCARGKGGRAAVRELRRAAEERT